MDKRQLILSQFPSFSEEELADRLIKEGQYLKLNSKEELLSHGNYINAIPLVLSGSIKVFREHQSGKEIFLYYILGGQSCAMTLNSCFRREKSSIRAVTQETTEILALPVQLVYEFNKKYASWQTFVFSTFNNRFEEILSVLDSVVFQKMDTRIIQLLERHAAVSKTSTIAISHQAIAEEMATSREVVSRLLKKLEQENYLALSRGQITLL